MKLYTEEQVKEMLIKTDQFTPLHIDHLMNEIISIELPSDEEIVEFYDRFIDLDTDWIIGAIWMRDKTQGGNK